MMETNRNGWSDLNGNRFERQNRTSVHHVPRPQTGEMRSLRSSNSPENCEFGYADAGWSESRNAADGSFIPGSARAHRGASGTER